MIESICSASVVICGVKVPLVFFAIHSAIAAPAAGLSREQIRQAQINGLEMAFLSAEEKRALREKVAAK